jgi:hypothetical protein
MLLLLPVAQPAWQFQTWLHSTGRLFIANHVRQYQKGRAP